MSKVLSLAFTFTALTLSTHAYSAQFASVIEAIAVPKGVEYNVRGWEHTDVIKGVNWEWPYYESGAHDSTMKGTTKFGNHKNPNIGSTEITIDGARTFITDIDISIQNEGDNPSVDAVHKLFGEGKVIKIPSSCDLDYATSADASYQFTKPSYQPVFIRYKSSWGASGSGSVNIKIANNLVYINDRYDDCYDQQTLKQWQVNY